VPNKLRTCKGDSHKNHGTLLLKKEKEKGKKEGERDIPFKRFATYRSTSL
jgi:hypothetical protein